MVKTKNSLYEKIRRRFRKLRIITKYFTSKKKKLAIKQMHGCFTANKEHAEVRGLRRRHDPISTSSTSTPQVEWVAKSGAQAHGAADHSKRSQDSHALRAAASSGVATCAACLPSLEAHVRTTRPRCKPPPRGQGVHRVRTAPAHTATRRSTTPEPRPFPGL